MTPMVDLTPLPNVLQSFRYQGLSWWACLAELFDNAWDAGSETIYVHFQPDALEVCDDGQGCPALARMLTMGDRQDHGSTILGRYGIGLKDAAISLAEQIDIVSRHQGTERRLVCNWKTLEMGRSWAIPGPTALATTAPNGTCIRLSGNLRKRQGVPDLMARLGLTYLPALTSGKRILWKSGRDKEWTPVAPFAFPRLTETQCATFVIAGKSATVTMGLLPEGPVHEKCLGLMFLYGYRVIETNQRLGLGPEPTPGLFGTIEFSRDWQLTKNKSGLAEEQYALDVQMARTFQDLIARAVRRGLSLPFHQLQEEMNQVLDSLFQQYSPAKAKRQPPSQATGAVLPTHTGSGHQRAACVQPGRRFLIPRTDEGLKIAFQDLANTAVYEISNNVLTFNTSNETVQRLREDETALKVLAVAALARHMVPHSPQQLVLPGVFKDIRVYEGTEEQIRYVEGILLKHMLLGTRAPLPADVDTPRRGLEKVR